MTPRQVQKCAERLKAFHDRLAPCFRDKRQAPWCQKWVHGLLLDGISKNAAELARAVPGGDVQAMQQFLTDSSWQCEPLIGQLQAMAEEVLGCPDGILVADDTGFPKKGTESVGVARQYSGTLGKVDNCQIGVFLAYVTSKGRLLVDGRLYLPKEWAQDRARRSKAGVAPSRHLVHAGGLVPDDRAGQVHKKGLGLSIRQTVLLLQQVLRRRELTKAQAIHLIEEQLARNEAAARSHLRRCRPKRGRQAAPS